MEKFIEKLEKIVSFLAVTVMIYETSKFLLEMLKKGNPVVEQVELAKERGENE